MVCVYVVEGDHPLASRTYHGHAFTHDHARTVVEHEWEDETSLDPAEADPEWKDDEEDSLPKARYGKYSEDSDFDDDEQQAQAVEYLDER